MNSTGSWFLIGSFLLMPAALLTLGVRLLAQVAAPDARARSIRNAAALCALWMLGWSVVGVSGAFDHWETRPPRAFFMLGALFAVTLTLAFGVVGKGLRGLSTRTLIGVQAFRLPLELLMYRAALEGLMPIQMSFAGYNYEILTGSSAALIWTYGAVSKRALPNWVGWAFSALGLSTLLTILGIALASMPTFAAFGPDRLNTWVMHFPYVLLPAVMVQVALLGHVVLLRKLSFERTHAQQDSAHGLTDQRQRA